MAEVPGQPQPDDAWIGGRRLADELEGAVVRAVVDEHELVRPPGSASSTAASRRWSSGNTVSSSWSAIATEMRGGRMAA